MRAKSAGSALLATKLHGPFMPGPVNQRPESSTKYWLLVVSTKTSPVVFDAHSSFVPLIGTKSGWPRKTISSVGTWLVTIVGTPLASDGFGFAFGGPSSMSTTPVLATACAASVMPIGVASAFVHGPAILLALSQPSYTWM
jgi:hypothetical protein